VAVYDDEGSRLWQMLLAHVDQNQVPNNLLVNEPSLSTQRIGGSCGR
jgi:lipopolysaccharide export system protein LptC